MSTSRSIASSDFVVCTRPGTPVVPEPFDTASPGDCIIRSSDGLEYKVFRVLLSLASPVFLSMFDLPQPATNDTEWEEGLPTISVSETSTTLSTLLLLLYPATVVRIPNYDLAVEVIKAYDKYDINIDSLHPFLHDALISEEGLASNPLGVYALAWRLNMQEEAQKASRYLHSVDLNDEAVKQDLVSQSGDLSALLALWDLRVRRGRALDGIVGAIGFASVLCGGHQYIHNLQAEVASLRNSAWESLQAPFPVCSDASQFFRTSCGNCINMRRSLNDAQLTNLRGLITAFPQTITWK
ncbi:hypothetical protein FRB95_004624 [Tulasnella sp. JGI-2019a]|nr:hypothetical protein FRB93_000015 [Tulasnella sp. JGI-2019a]KAG9030037.1 hypothetical protein FRB95_004624 [Tulasnella sp. JGI-2019a]